MTLVHATCIAIDEAGVLIRGPSGSGKSDLALRLIDAGATLVADDYCTLSAQNGQVTAEVPDTIAGRLEVRGYGIVRLPYISPVPLKLVVDLTHQTDIERYPDPAAFTLEGVTLNRIDLDATTPSATAKVRLALRATPEDADTP